jgi:hypothetical protein
MRAEMFPGAMTAGEIDAFISENTRG